MLKEDLKKLKETRKLTGTLPKLKTLFTHTIPGKLGSLWSSLSIHKLKPTRRLIIGVLCLLVAMSGITFAWFTELQQLVGGNLALGHLDASMQVYDSSFNRVGITPDGGSGQTPVFADNELLAADSIYRYIMVTNTGTIDAKVFLQFALDMAEYTDNTLNDVRFTMADVTAHMNSTYPRAGQDSDEARFQAYVSAGGAASHSPSFGESRTLKEMQSGQKLGTLEVEETYFYVLQCSVNTSSYNLTVHGDGSQTVEGGEILIPAIENFELVLKQFNAPDVDNSESGEIIYIDSVEAFKKAIATASDGDTLYLSRSLDLGEGYNLYIKRRINLSLNGYTLTVHGDMAYDTASGGICTLDVTGSSKLVVEGDLRIIMPSGSFRLVGSGGSNVILGTTRTPGAVYVDTLRDSNQGGYTQNQVSVKTYVQGTDVLTDANMVVYKTTRVEIGPDCRVGTISASAGAMDITVINNGQVKQIDMTAMINLPGVADQIYILHGGTFTAEDYGVLLPLWADGPVTADQGKENYVNCRVINDAGVTQEWKVAVLYSGTPVAGESREAYIAGGGDQTTAKGIYFWQCDIQNNHDPEVKVVRNAAYDYTVYIYENQLIPTDSSVQKLLAEYFSENSVYAQEATVIEKLAIRTYDLGTVTEADFNYMRTTLKSLATLDISAAALTKDGGGLASIPAGAMKGCSTLSEVVLPTGFNYSIGTEAFCDCSIQEVTLTERCQSVGANAFKPQVKEGVMGKVFVSWKSDIEMPDTVYGGFSTSYARFFMDTNLVRLAFTNNRNYRSYSFESYDMITDGGVHLMNLGNSTAKVVYYEGLDASQGLAARFTVEGLSYEPVIVGINAYRHAFASTDSTDVWYNLVLPESITEVREYAFYGRTRVAVIRGAGVTDAGAFAFSCKNMVELHLPKLTAADLLFLGANADDASLNLRYLETGVLTELSGTGTAWSNLSLEVYKINAAGSSAATADIKAVSISGAPIARVLVDDPTYAQYYRDFVYKRQVTDVSGTTWLLASPEGESGATGRFVINKQGAMNDQIAYTMGGSFTDTQNQSVPYTIAGNYIYGFREGGENEVALLGSLHSKDSFPVTEGVYTIPAELQGRAVTAIGRNAFYGVDFPACHLVVPASVTTLEAEGFINATGFTAITLEAESLSMGKAVFSGCASLQDVTIPGDIYDTDASVEGGIPANTFYYCSALEDVDIPKAKQIGNSAFHYCTAVEYLYLPSVNRVCTNGIARMSSIRELRLPKLHELENQAFGFMGPNDYIFDLVYLETGVLTYRDFNQFTGPKLPALQVYRIVEDPDYPVAVNDMLCLFGVYPSRFIQLMPERYIDRYVSQFTAVGVEFPHPVIPLEEDPQYYTPDCEEPIALLEGSYVFGAEGNSIGGNYMYVTNEDGQSATLVASLGGSDLIRTHYADGVYTVPATVTQEGAALSVTAIGDSAFQSFPFPEDWVVELHFPETIKTVGARAFAGATGSMQVFLDHDVLVGEKCFMNAAVQSLTSAATVELGAQSFDGCTVLTTVDCENATVTLGTNGFSGCTALETVNIGTMHSCVGNVVTENDLPAGTFSGCTALKTIRLSTVETVGNSAFAGCTALKDVNLEQAQTLGNSVFSGCSSLASLTLPVASSLGDNTIVCTNLTELRLPQVKALGTGAIQAENLYYLETGMLQSVLKPSTGAQKDNSFPNLRIYQICTGDNTELPKAYLTLPARAVILVNETYANNYADFETVVVEPDALYYGTPSWEEALQWPGYTLGGTHGNGEPVAIGGNYVFRKDGSSLTLLYSLHDAMPVSSGEYTTPDGINGMSVTKAVAGVFRHTDMTGVDTLNLNGIQYLEGDEIFAGCSMSTVKAPSLLSINGNHIFQGCNNLTAIYLSGSSAVLTTEGTVASDNTQGITVYVPANLLTAYTNLGNDWYGIPLTNFRSIGSVVVSGSVSYYLEEYMDGLMVTMIELASGGEIGTLVIPNQASITQDGTQVTKDIIALGKASMRNITQSRITEITLPNGLVVFAVDPSDIPMGLTAYSMTDNKTFQVKAGVLYSGTALVSYPRGLTGSLTVDETVTVMGDGAFYGSGLTDITVSQPVTIGDRAFANAQSLARITFTHATPSFFLGADTITGAGDGLVIQVPNQSYVDAAYRDANVRKAMEIAGAGTQELPHEGSDEQAEGGNRLLSANDFVILPQAGNTAILHSYTGSDTDVSVPASITCGAEGEEQTYAITAVDPAFFQGLKTVYLPPELVTAILGVDVVPEDLIIIAGGEQAELLYRNLIADREAILVDPEALKALEGEGKEDESDLPDEKEKDTATGLANPLPGVGLPTTPAEPYNPNGL